MTHPGAEEVKKRAERRASTSRAMLPREGEDSDEEMTGERRANAEMRAEETAQQGEYG